MVRREIFIILGVLLILSILPLIKPDITISNSLWSNNAKSSELKAEANNSAISISKDNLYFNILLPLSLSNSKDLTNKLTLTSETYNSNIYMKGNEVEWEINLTKNPKGVISIPISKNIGCSYTEPLTQKEINNGDFQENPGSYYCQLKNEKNSPPNYLLIKRPFLTDAGGKIEWCNQTLTNNLLTINCPQDFLDNALYPVIIDPTFGMTTQGGTGRSTTAVSRCMQFNLLEEATIKNMSVYTQDIGSGNGDAKGITSNGTYIWMIDNTDREVYRYWMNGTYINSFDTNGAGAAAPWGITNNATHLFITEYTDDLVYIYLMNGTYVSSFNLVPTGVTTSRGITTNGTYFWITDLGTDKVYQFLVNGTNTTFNFDTSGSGCGDPYGIVQNGTYFWITDNVDEEVYQYWMNGTYVSSFDLGIYGINNSQGIIINGTDLWIIDSESLGGNDEIYVFYMNGTYKNEFMSTNGLSYMSMSIYDGTWEVSPPQNLVVSNTSFVTTPGLWGAAGWRTFTVTPTTIPIGAYYICVEGSGTYNYYTNIQTGTYTAGKTYANPWANPFGASSFSTAYNISLYASYDYPTIKVTPVSPTASQNFTNLNYINFSCNVSDPSYNITNVTLNVENSTGLYTSTSNQTNIFASTNITYYFNNVYLPFLANPLHTYYCTATNNQSEITSSSDTNFYVRKTNRFVSPTPVSSTVTTDWIYLNYTIIETCGTGANELKIEFDGVNTSILSGGSLSPPTTYNLNKTGLSGGNHTYQIWCNGANWDYSWTVVENVDSLTSTINSPTNDFHQDNYTGIINCSGYAPSGVTNISLFADFNNVKYEYLLVNSTGFDGTQTNVSYVFNNSIGIINDTYNYYCRVQSVGGNYANSTINTIKIGKAIVYIVQAVDTESWEREKTDNQYSMSLDLRSYNITNFADYGSTSNGITINLFDEDWRNLYNDSTNEQVKFTWYIMTHEAHCHATNAYQTPGCNIIADIMYGNNSLKFFNYNGIWQSEIEKWGDDYGWHNHHSYWNGTTQTDSSGNWLGTLLSDFYFNGTSLFYNNTINETDYLRAEKLVSLFSYENDLAWTSFRAGWLVEGAGEHKINYLNFLSNNTALDFTDQPLLSGNLFEPERFKDTQGRLIGFKCVGGIPTNVQLNNSFAYAQNGTIVVMCAYMHNYAGATIKSDTSGLNTLAKSASTNYSVNFVYATALEAAQAYFRMNDTTPPDIDLNFDGDLVVADVNEPLYMPPSITLLTIAGNTTPYQLFYMTKVNESRYTFNKSSLASITLSYKVRATDKRFNVAISPMYGSFLDILQPTTASPVQVTYPQNITVHFQYFQMGNEIAAGNIFKNVTIGSTLCPNISAAEYIHTIGTDGYWEVNCSAPDLSGTQDISVSASTGASNLTGTETNAVTYGQIYTTTVTNLINSFTSIFKTGKFFKFPSLSLISSALINRLGNFFKTLPQTITLTEILLRSKNLILTITQSLTFFGLIGKMFITLVKPVSSFSLNNQIDSDFLGKRSMSDSLTFSSELNKNYQGVRLNQAQLSIYNQVNKWFGGTRGLQDSLTLSDSVFGIPIYLVITSQPMSFSELLLRTGNLNRITSNQISVTGIVGERFFGTRNPNQNINYFGILGKSFSGIRTTTQPISISDSTKRLASFGKIILSPFAFNTIIKDNYQGTRMNIVQLSFYNQINRIFSGNRQVTSSFAVSSFISKNSLFKRTLSQPMTLTESINRLANLIRSLLQSLGLTNQIQTTPNLYLLDITQPNSTSPQTITAGENITIYFNFTKFGSPITSNVNVTNITIGGNECPNSSALIYNSPLWEVNCTVPSGTGLNDLVLSANYTTDSVVRTNTESQSVTYSTIQYYSRNAVLSFLFSDSLQKKLFGNRITKLSITSSQALTRFGILGRINIFNIQINNLLDRLYSGNRNLNQQLSIITNAIRNLFGQRTNTQVIDISDSAIRKDLSSRLNSNTISFSGIVGENLFGVRTSTQDINIFGIVGKKLSGLRITTQNINLFGTVGRTLFAQRTASDSLTLSNIINSLYTDIGTINERGVTQSFGILGDINKLKLNVRILNQDINFNIIILKTNNFIRNIIDSFLMSINILTSYQEYVPAPGSGNQGMITCYYLNDDYSCSPYITSSSCPIGYVQTLEECEFYKKNGGKWVIDINRYLEDIAKKVSPSHVGLMKNIILVFILVITFLPAILLIKLKNRKKIKQRW